jgi:predicted lysophospholipase L1 biosynthesis ABC-type transport system permease subunit
MQDARERPAAKVPARVEGYLILGVASGVVAIAASLAFLYFYVAGAWTVSFEKHAGIVYVFHYTMWGGMVGSAVAATLWHVAWTASNYLRQ